MALREPKSTRDMAGEICIFEYEVKIIIHADG
jgi:hypothetical protein